MEWGEKYEDDLGNVRGPFSLSLSLSLSFSLSFSLALSLSLSLTILYLNEGSLSLSRTLVPSFSFSPSLSLLSPLSLSLSPSLPLSRSGVVDLCVSDLLSDKRRSELCIRLAWLAMPDRVAGTPPMPCLGLLTYADVC